MGAESGIILKYYHLTVTGFTTPESFDEFGFRSVVRTFTAGIGDSGLDASIGATAGDLFDGRGFAWDTCPFDHLRPNVTSMTAQGKVTEGTAEGAHIGYWTATVEQRDDLTKDEVKAVLATFEGAGR